VNYNFTDEESTFNASLDAADLLMQMGFTESSLYHEGNSIRLFCPLHKDQVRRSLIIYTDKNTYRCQYMNCPGHKGGNLLDFYAAYTGCEVGEVVGRIKSQGEGDTDLVERADKLIQEGSLVEAVPLLTKAVQLDSSNVISRCRLAALYLELGDRDRGYREYLTAAEHFGVRGELDKTLHIYNILLIISPDDVKVRKQLSYLFSRLKREDEAVAQLKWVVDRHVRKGEMKDAGQICRKMIELCPEYPDSHRILGEILLRQGNQFDAVEELRTATAHYVRENNLKKAKETIELGLRYTPGNPAMREMASKIDHALKLKKAAGDTKGEREQAFEAWLSDLKTSIGVKDGETAEPTVGGVAQVEPVPKTATESGKATTGSRAASKTKSAGRASTATAARAAASDRPATLSHAKRLYGTGQLPKMSQDDPRIQLFKMNLEGRSDEQIESLYQHLVTMFNESQEGVEEGLLSEFEGKVVREFYAAFCLAMDTMRRTAAAG
jgi:thioredoxin-like negative regulator of GroEL